MTKKPEELFHRHSLNKQFLLSKTDPKPKEDKTGFKISEDLAELSKIFQDIPVEDSFVDYSMVKLQSSSIFSAMVIGIDKSEHKKGVPIKEYVSTVKIDVAKTVNQICERENGMWGLVSHDFFGCFFLDKNEDDCLKLAKRLKQNLSKRINETVTIGIASYPAFKFKKRRILGNACKAFDHAEFFGPDSTVSFDAVSLNISSDKLYDKGDIAGAIKELNTALLFDPSDVNVHNSLGVCHGVLCDYKKALKEFKAAISLNGNEVMATYNAGMANMLKGNKKEALEYLLKAYEIDKNIFEVAFQTGKLYLEMEQPDKGKKFIEKAIKLKPKSGSAFSILGDCYTALDMIDKAISAYQKAVKLNANDAASLSSLGWLFDAQGENLEIATLFCRQSVDISPENGLFRNRLGRLYYKANRTEDALKEFEAAQKLGYESTQEIEQIQNLPHAKAS